MAALTKMKTFWLLFLLSRAASQQPPDLPWRALSSLTLLAPSERAGHTAIWCSPLGGLIVFGGQGQGGDLFNDVWRWWGTGWVRLTPLADSLDWPRERTSHTAVCTEEGMVVFGGSCGSSCFLDDVWVLEAPDPDQPTAVLWRRESALGLSWPIARAGHSAVWQRERGRMLVFGGQVLVGGALLDDTWALSTSTFAWTRLVAAGVQGNVGGRRDAAAGLVGGLMHVFSGWRGSQLEDDLWRLEPNSSWTQLQQTGGPGARRAAASSSAPDGSSFAVCAGTSLDADSIESDRFDLHIHKGHGVWESLAVGVSPPLSRRYSTIAWQPDLQRLFLFGGSRTTDGVDHLNDLRELDLPTARLYGDKYAEYQRQLDALAKRNDTAPPGDARTTAGGITVDFSFLDALFTDMSLAAAGVIVFGIPGVFCLCCVCSGIYRQRRRALARKRAEARERVNAEGGE